MGEDVPAAFRRHMTAVALLIAFASPAIAEPAIVERVLDGDTIRATVAGRSVTIRVVGIDTPETHICRPGRAVDGGCAKCPAEVERGLAARSAAQALLPVGAVIDVAQSRSRDRYRRMLARITLPDGRDYGATMIQRGLAAPYPGRGPKPDWCQRPYAVRFLERGRAGVVAGAGARPAIVRPGIGSGMTA